MAAGASAAAPAAGSSDPTPIAIAAAAAVVITNMHVEATAPLSHRFIASLLCLFALVSVVFDSLCRARRSSCDKTTERFARS